MNSYRPPSEISALLNKQKHFFFGSPTLGPIPISIPIPIPS